MDRRGWRILAHILQYDHDFQSNVALFPSVVQAYTQPYLFSGRIKLIICQIKHELNVTVYEISTSWKKTLDGGPKSITLPQDHLGSLWLNKNVLIPIPSFYVATNILRIPKQNWKHLILIHFVYLNSYLEVQNKVTLKLE